MVKQMSETNLKFQQNMEASRIIFRIHIEQLASCMYNFVDSLNNVSVKSSSAMKRLKRLY